MARGEMIDKGVRGLKGGGASCLDELFGLEESLKMTHLPGSSAHENERLTDRPPGEELDNIF